MVAEVKLVETAELVSIVQGTKERVVPAHINLLGREQQPNACNLAPAAPTVNSKNLARHSKAHCL